MLPSSWLKQPIDDVDNFTDVSEDQGRAELHAAVSDAAVSDAAGLCFYSVLFSAIVLQGWPMTTLHGVVCHWRVFVGR